MTQRAADASRSRSTACRGPDVARRRRRAPAGRAPSPSTSRPTGCARSRSSSRSRATSSKPGLTGFDLHGPRPRRFGSGSARRPILRSRELTTWLLTGNASFGSTIDQPLHRPAHARGHARLLRRRSSPSTRAWRRGDRHLPRPRRREQLRRQPALRRAARRGPRAGRGRLAASTRCRRQACSRSRLRRARRRAAPRLDVIARPGARSTTAQDRTLHPRRRTARLPRRRGAAARAVGGRDRGPRGRRCSSSARCSGSSSAGRAADGRAHALAVSGGCCTPTAFARRAAARSIRRSSDDHGRGPATSTSSCPRCTAPAASRRSRTPRRRPRRRTGARQPHHAPRRRRLRRRRGRPTRMLAAIEGARLHRPPLRCRRARRRGRDAIGGELARARLAVAGFAAGNIMLLSVSVWSGASGATRDLFHWLSALIALPADRLCRPAVLPLRLARARRRPPQHGRADLDRRDRSPPRMSLYETATQRRARLFRRRGHRCSSSCSSGAASTTAMRDVARSAAARLLSLSARERHAPRAPTAPSLCPIGEIAAGRHGARRRRRAPPGRRHRRERRAATSTARCSPARRSREPVAAGGKVFAGTLNLDRPADDRASPPPAGDTLLADIVRLMEAAERSGQPLRPLADRASRLYAPVVHLLALATFVGWLVVGGGWHQALTGRGRRADHHLPLRARPRRAGRAGRGQRLAARAAASC